MEKCDEVCYTKCSESTPLLVSPSNTLPRFDVLTSPCALSHGSNSQLNDVLSFYPGRTFAAAVGHPLDYSASRVSRDNTSIFTLEVLRSPIQVCGLQPPCSKAKLERCALQEGAIVEVLEVVESMDSSNSRARVVVTYLSSRDEQPVVDARWRLSQIWEWSKRLFCCFEACNSRRIVGEEGGMSFHRNAKLHDIGWIDAVHLIKVDNEKKVAEERRNHIHIGLDEIDASNTSHKVEEEQKSSFVKVTSDPDVIRPATSTTASPQSLQNSDETFQENQQETVVNGRYIDCVPTQWDLFVRKLKDSGEYISNRTILKALEHAKSSVLDQSNSISHLLGKVVQLEGFSFGCLCKSLFPMLKHAVSQSASHSNRKPLGLIDENKLNLRDFKSTTLRSSQGSSKIYELPKNRSLNLRPRRYLNFSSGLIQDILSLYLKTHGKKEFWTDQHFPPFCDELSNRVKSIAVYEDGEIYVYFNQLLRGSQANTSVGSEDNSLENNGISLKASERLKELLLTSLCPKRIPFHMQVSHDIEFFFTPCIRFTVSYQHPGGYQVKTSRPGDIRCKGLFGNLVMNLAVTLQGNCLRVEAAHLNCSIALEDIVSALFCDNQQLNLFHFNDDVENENLYIQSLNVL